MENEVTRRIRDYDTGEISYVGSGFFDIISKIGSKLTGKTASKLALQLTIHQKQIQLIGIMHILKLTFNLLLLLMALE